MKMLMHAELLLLLVLAIKSVKVFCSLSYPVQLVLGICGTSLPIVSHWLFGHSRVHACLALGSWDMAVSGTRRVFLQIGKWLYFPLCAGLVTVSSTRRVFLQIGRWLPSLGAGPVPVLGIIMVCLQIGGWLPLLSSGPAQASFLLRCFPLMLFLINCSFHSHMLTL